jgi:hypothetical protein
MTWQELDDKIQGMTNEQRNYQTARFWDRYEPDALVIPVEVVFAEENVLGDAEEIAIKKGDPFLT